MNLTKKNDWVSYRTFFALVVISASPFAAFSQSVDEVGESHIDWLKHRLERPAPNDVMVVAHRGCWLDTAENSLAGIERCVELGVDMIEIDVRSSRDGQLMLMHDETVDRTTNGTGVVGDLTSSDLRQLRLRQGAGDGDAELTQQRVPTLEEALSAARDRLLVNLDIKETLYDQAMETARRVGSESQIVIKMATDANDPRLANAAFHGEMYFMPIIRECTDDPARFCSPRLHDAVGAYARYNPIAVEVVNHTDDYLVDGANAVREQNARLWVNTLPGFAAGRSDDKSLVDPDGNWGFLVNIGVNMIQTDRPEALLTYLKSRGLRIED